ncbi:hypothetical protein [Leptolyngbya subtilissima]|uniref:hypothetical protein n=1 Tax=Leptolyngbya subtilissima TaxID=1346803 RepID=UPI0032970035
MTNYCHPKLFLTWPDSKRFELVLPLFKGTVVTRHSVALARSGRVKFGLVLARAIAARFEGS